MASSRRYTWNGEGSPRTVADLARDQVLLKLEPKEQLVAGRKLIDDAPKSGTAVAVVDLGRPACPECATIERVPMGGQDRLRRMCPRCRVEYNSPDFLGVLAPHQKSRPGCSPTQ